MVISILAAIALPAYQNYIARSQVAEAFTLADGLKTSIGTNRQNGTCGTEEITGKYGTAKILEDKGTGTPAKLTCGINYKFNTTGVSDFLTGKQITLKLDDDSGALKLDVMKGGENTVEEKYLPSAFKK
ncbi:class II pilin PilE [Moraxella macacae 0408225]|uniref:Class II pilin PilE n=1 Tax=Moraxella macacae 0408225 TaxID=1230338 RepID=L2F4Q0_9GAMM|nr:class II pilin PilE [Moraxella macacae 0408225]